MSLKTVQCPPQEPTHCPRIRRSKTRAFHRSAVIPITRARFEAAGEKRVHTIPQHPSLYRGTSLAGTHNAYYCLLGA